MRDDPSVKTLVERARTGDRDAWNQIVERYAPLVWSTCVRHRVFGADADDVAANVWLRLVERLDTIREPAALPGWLATTTRRECLQLLKTRQRQVPVDGESIPDGAVEASDQWLLRQERQIALRTAFATLSERCRALLSMLFGEPSVPYAEISAGLGIAIGGIGPTRRRCLDSLRGHPLIAALDGQRDDRLGDRLGDEREE